MTSRQIETIEGFVSGDIRRDEPLSDHTTFRVGGNADLWLRPGPPDDLVSLVAFLSSEQIPYKVMGRGSNVLVSDAGFRGVILDISEACATLAVDGTLVRVGAGVANKRLLGATLKGRLSGIEFLADIPGSVGGSLVVNAGAWRETLGDIVKEINILDPSGTKTYPRDAFTWEYHRKGNISDFGIIVEAVFELRRGDMAKSKKKVREYIRKRCESQPRGVASAGCAFRNPPDAAASRLIDQAGLKGLTRGRAAVSEKHANFIVNLGGASAEDVLAVINEVRDRVADEFGLELEREVELVGWES
ncbi:UDP-N-acetylmuramate dehydrogenase [Candidatus Hydrogenedentota bacterium]